MIQAPARRWAYTRGEWTARRSVIEPARHHDRIIEERPVADTAGVWGWRLALVSGAVWASSPVVGFETALTVLNFIGFGAAVAGFTVPSMGLIGIGMLCVLEPITGPLLATGGLWRWNNLNYWLLFVLVLFLPFLVRRRDLHSRCLQILVVVLAVGLFKSVDLFTGTQYLFAMVTAFGLLVYFWRVIREPSAWYWLGVVSGVVAGLGCLAFFLQRADLPPLNRNVWCLFPLTALFAICIGFRQSRDLQQQLILGGVAAINLVWVFVSASRGGVLTGIMCLLFLLTELRARSRRVIGLAIATVLLLAVVSQLAGPRQAVIDRFAELFDQTKSASERTSNRSDLALAGWRIFRNEPMGTGTGGFSAAQSELALFSWSRDKDYAAHSGWIRVLAENGLPGIVALIAYVGSFAYAGWRHRRQGLLAFGALVTIIFCINLISYEFEYKGIWLLAAGATIVLDPSARRSRLSAPPVLKV